MGASPGVNVPHRGLTNIDNARNLGARWVRLVLVPDLFPSSLLAQYREAGLSVLAVLARESFPDEDFGRQTNAYVRMHGGDVDAWQIGNEPDHVSDSSWTLTQDEYAALLFVVAGAIGRARPDAIIVGAGGASGNPDYFRRGDILKWLDGVACHPYGQDADACRAPAGNFGLARDLIGRYAELGLPVWVTEYGCDDRPEAADEDACADYVGALTSQFMADPRVRVATHFCTTDAMVPGYGLLALDGTAKPAAAAYALAATESGGTDVATTDWDQDKQRIEEQISLLVENQRRILQGKWDEARIYLDAIDPAMAGQWTNCHFTGCDSGEV